MWQGREPHPRADDTKMVITTSITASKRLTEKAISIGEKYNIPYIPRRERSLEYIFEHCDRQVFVVNDRHGLSVYESGKQEAFFHPNMAFLRMKNLMNGGKDSLAEVCALHTGLSFLDATLGLASDALTASFVLGGNGVCTGLEKSKIIYILVKEGLVHYAEQYPEFRESAERIGIHHCDNIEYLKACGRGQYDIVYFDFMFAEPISASKGIQMIRDYAAKDSLSPLCFEEAKRVAGRSVVVKCDRGDVKRLLEMGFKVQKENSRKSFYYLKYEKKE